MNKKIPWWEPKTDGKKEKEMINKVLDSNFPNDGKLTTKLENKIARLLGCKHIIVLTSATTAMFLSLKGLGIGHGDEVIVPDITFIATANAVEMAGAKPVLVDVDPTSLTISVEAIKNNITHKTKAIIPVHVSGRAANMKEIMKLANKHKIQVIEDAAEAFMSKYQGRFLGTIGRSGCFSLSPAKTITTGQGGFIATNDSKLYSRLVELKDQGRPKRGTGGNDIHISVGYNFKFTDLQAALGLAQLTYLNTRIKRAKRNYLLYKQYLNGLKGISLLNFDIKNGAVPQWTDALVENRDRLISHLQDNNIEFRKFWYPLHTQKPYKQPDKNFPDATRLYRNALWLPSSYTLTDKDIRKVCEVIKSAV